MYYQSIGRSAGFRSRHHKMARQTYTRLKMWRFYILSAVDALDDTTRTTPNVINSRTLCRRNRRIVAVSSGS